jgi:hypothetical protein
MKSFVLAFPFAMLLVTTVAAAEDKLPTAWPSHTQLATAETPPPTGTPFLFAGTGILAVGIGLGIGGMALPTTNQAQVNTAIGFEVGSLVAGVVGTTLGVVGLVEGMRYDRWCASHPLIAGVQVSPTSVGYHLSF